MTHIGKCLTARGVKPIVKYQHRFANTYLFGAYSPIDGDSFVYEIEHISKSIFQQYLTTLSAHRPNEFKIVVMDNAGFHSVKDWVVPNNIYLLAIPPYSPELNPCEKVWQYIKDRFRNNSYENMNQLKEWLYKQVNKMTKEIIKNITHHKEYLKAFKASF